MSKYARLLLAATEAAKGVDQVPTPASNAIRFLTATPVKNQDNLDRPVTKTTMGMLPHLVGKETMQLEIVAELHGSGVVDTPPELAPFFRACGLAETITAATKVEYDPTTNGIESCTIYYYHGGLLWKFIGAVGTFSIDCTINQIITVTFTMQAVYAEPTIAAVPGGAVFNSTLPIVAKATDTVSDGAAIQVGAFGLDCGNEVIDLYRTGSHDFRVINRAPQLNFNKNAAATIAEWQALANATSAALSGVYGVAGGNRLSISAPKGVRDSVALAEEADIDTQDVAYRLYEVAGDDQFQLRFD